jgi:hypothetical protein
MWYTPHYDASITHNSAYPANSSLKLETNMAGLVEKLVNLVGR